MKYKKSQKYKKSKKMYNLYGAGRINYSNGEYYIGEIMASNPQIRHGIGKLYNRAGQILYDGPWVNDKQHTALETQQFALWKSDFRVYNPDDNSQSRLEHNNLLRCCFQHGKFDNTKNVSFPSTFDVNNLSNSSISFGYHGRFNPALCLPHHTQKDNFRPAILKFDNKIYHTFFEKGKIHGIAYVTDINGALISVTKWNNGVLDTNPIEMTDTHFPKHMKHLEYTGFMHLFRARLVGENASLVWHMMMPYFISHYTGLGVEAETPFTEFDLGLTERFNELTFMPQCNSLVQSACSIFGDSFESQKDTLGVQFSHQGIGTNHLTRVLRALKESPNAGIKLFDTNEKTVFEVSCISSFTNAIVYSTYRLINFIFQHVNIRTISITQYILILKHPIIINFVKGLNKCISVSQLLPHVRRLYIHHVSLAMGSSISIPTLNYVYRCIHATDEIVSAHYITLQPGITVTFNVFQSFTLRLTERIISSFGPAYRRGRNLVIFRIESVNCTARCISHYSVVDAEDEVLTLPNILYEVVDIQRFDPDFSRFSKVRDVLGTYDEVPIDDHVLRSLLVRDPLDSGTVIIITLRETQAYYSADTFLRSRILRGGYYE